MDRETKKSIRQSYAVIVVAIAIFVFTGIGLIIMGIRSIRVTAVKTLRSEFAHKVQGRETFRCNATWRPLDAYEAVDAGEIPNPRKISMNFAMQDDGRKFYLDRYFDGEKYLAFYANGDNVYSWSAMEYLWSNGMLYDIELRLPTAPSVKMSRAEFDSEYPSFFEEIDQMIKDFPPSTEIYCDIGGTMGYSQPDKITDWQSLKQVKEQEKTDNEQEEIEKEGAEKNE